MDKIRRVEPISPANPIQNRRRGHVSDWPVRDELGHVSAIPMYHKAVRVDNLMYNGCEPHWKCTRCGVCVPFHCYTKSQFEAQECQERCKADG